jgi:hypothetical protein
MPSANIKEHGSEFLESRDTAELQAAERICALARRGDWHAVQDEARRQHAIHLQRAFGGLGRRSLGVLRAGAHRLTKVAHLTNYRPRKA